MPSRILIVEDDPDIAEALRYNLEKAGFEAQCAEHGERALELLSERPPDLVLLDLMLPGISGLDVCRRIRAAPATALLPVLMLTAKGEESDRLEGFDAGADDYVTKPFSIQEVLRRIQAILRRAQPAGAARASFQIKDLHVELPLQRALLSGEDLRLTGIEFKLLWHVLRNSAQTLTRQWLLENVWGYASGTESRTVDVHLRRLREKLGAYADVVETVRGSGYRYNATRYGPL